MKSIDTLYNGNYFRSRLEARWAYFFDLCNIDYEYEPNGYKNSNGEYYLPDFYLPNVYLRYFNAKGLFIEIKPSSYKKSDIVQSKWFDKPLVLCKGNAIDCIWGQGDSESCCELTPYWDNEMGFWMCDTCGTTKIEFWEGNYNDCPNPKCRGKLDLELLNQFATMAIKKRFEHGQ